jgi:uncharacterized protein (DUF302 family)
MSVRSITVERFSVISSKPFEQVLAAINGAIGHPEIKVFSGEMREARSYAELTTIVEKAVAGSSFMEFIRFDMGEVLRKANGPGAPRVVRLVIGNPLIMKTMVEHVPDAASYAPVTILIDQRADGVHLSYDRVASFLALYGNAKASTVARDLDSKVETLLCNAAF